MLGELKNVIVEADEDAQDEEVKEIYEELKAFFESEGASLREEPPVQYSTGADDKRRMWVMYVRADESPIVTTTETINMAGSIIWTVTGESVRPVGRSSIGSAYVENSRAFVYIEEPVNPRFSIKVTVGPVRKQ